MKVARMGLTKPVKEGDYDGLVEVMGHLMKVKERQTATDNMFEPLKQTIELLKSYGEEMPEETHVKLQVDGTEMPCQGSWSPARQGQRRVGPCDPELVGQTSSSRSLLRSLGNSGVGGQGSPETRGQGDCLPRVGGE